MNCCFTGHREIPYDQMTRIYTLLHSTISNLIHEGTMCFYAGGALGFDTICAQVVLELKREYPAIKLILLLPCRSQTRYWNENEIEKYERIKREADEVHYVSIEYTKACMFRRNRALVDNADICVCYLKKNSGGTAYTVRYAESKGLRILNLAKK